MNPTSYNNNGPSALPVPAEQEAKAFNLAEGAALFAAFNLVSAPVGSGGQLPSTQPSPLQGRAKRVQREEAAPDVAGALFAKRQRQNKDQEFQQAVERFKNTQSSMAESFMVPELFDYFPQWSLLDEGRLEPNEDLGASLLSCRTEEDLTALRKFRSKKLAETATLLSSNRLQSALTYFMAKMQNMARQFENDPAATSYFQQWALLDEGKLKPNEDLGASLLSCKNAMDVYALSRFRNQKIKRTSHFLLSIMAQNAYSKPQRLALQTAQRDLQTTMRQMVGSFQNVPMIIHRLREWSYLDAGKLQPTNDLGRSILSCQTAKEVELLKDFRTKNIMTIHHQEQMKAKHFASCLEE